MRVNDIIAAGAEPSISLDYVATGKNEPANQSKWSLVWQKVVCRLVPHSLVGKLLKCRHVMAKMTMTWLVLRSV